MKAPGTVLAAVLVVAAMASSAVGPSSPASSAPGGAPSVTAPTQRVVDVVPAAARRVLPTYFGMHTATAGTLTDAQLAGMTPASGVGAVTLLGTGLNWRDVQPVAPVAGQDPGYQWDAMDSAVTNARSMGVTQVNLVLAGTPCWAAANKPGAGEPAPCYTSPPTSAGLSAWARFVRAVAERYTGRVTSIQIWSEADLINRWRGTPAQLAYMTLIAYRQIKAVNPKLIVAAASTTTRLHNLGTFYLPFLRQLARRTWPTDVYVGHFYPPANGTPVTRQQQILEFRATLAKAPAPAKPIWEGEVNYGVPGIHLKHVALDNALGAGYVARTFLDGLRFGISRVYWSAWVPKNAVYGVTMWPGYTYGTRALRATYSWLANKYWKGCAAASLSTGRFVTCLVSSTTSATSFTARIVWSEGRTRLWKVPTGVTKLCTVSGGCAATKAGRIYKIGQVPVWFGR